MKTDPIRQLLEEADLEALIDDVEAHPELDGVVIVTLKSRRDRASNAPPRGERAPKQG